MISKNVLARNVWEWQCPYCSTRQTSRDIKFEGTEECCVSCENMLVVAQLLQDSDSQKLAEVRENSYTKSETIEFAKWWYGPSSEKFSPNLNPSIGEGFEWWNKNVRKLANGRGSGE